MVAFSIASFSKFRTDLEALRKIAKEDIYWSASQLEVEMNRFLVAVGRYGLGVEDIDAQEVQDRFDIVWSRVELFRVGEVGERLNAYDRDHVVPNLREALREHEAMVLSASREDLAGLQRIVITFEPFHSELHELSGRVVVGEEARVAAARQTLRENAQRSVALIGGALAVGVALLFMMYFEARRFQALAAHNERLAESARKAGEAKSRFLSMMSHELRTPMNGVLGLLALIKQRGLPTAQNRLLDQAERSGRQMIEILTDILDFSALQRE
ncbi:MAG TPA: histidine kinase dimerization/phospho-acceptor domain-containing protein, partial [Sphingomonadaceae bacterium]|nr:histidine kinase dimerization/phospho-acceptor domain-containing protein [Sphingomonadaceae bacterium]